MKLLKDKNVIILIVILVVFTIGYFLIVNRISYAFVNDYDLEEVYNNTLDVIEKCALKYASDNANLFEKENTIYIKVQDLIDNNLLIPNENGYIVNPLKENENLNSNIIKIKYENDTYNVEIDS